MTTVDRTGSTDTTGAGPTLRVVTALALLVDAVVHLRLAPAYQLASPDGVGGGNLFRLEAVVALAAALFVLVRGSRRSYAVAFLVAVSALGALLVSRYLNVPMLGPLPAMYEPVWYFEKSLTAVAETIAAATAVAGVLLTSGPLGFGRSPSQAPRERSLSRNT